MRTVDIKEIQWCCGILLTRHFLEIVVLIIVYTKDEFELGIFSKVMLVASFLLNCGLIKLFADLEVQHAVWWATVLLLDIVLFFLVFFVALYQYLTWS